MVSNLKTVRSILFASMHQKRELLEVSATVAIKSMPMKEMAYFVVRTKFMDKSMRNCYAESIFYNSSYSRGSIRQGCDSVQLCTSAATYFSPTCEMDSFSFYVSIVHSADLAVNLKFFHLSGLLHSFYRATFKGSYFSAFA